jgi:hypothetical protein
MSDVMIVFASLIVMLIIIAVGVNALVSKAMAHSRWKTERKGNSSDASVRIADIAERTDLIEDRLRVLERITTDRGSLLAAEIEGLRIETGSNREKAKLPEEAPR